MDIGGARILSERIAQQKHWAQADAVRAGRAPAIDPDAERLTEMRDGLRVYESDIVSTAVGGRRARVTRVFCKELVDGEWRSFVDEHVELVG
jgi:hypothetical protein